MMGELQTLYQDWTVREAIEVRAIDKSKGESAMNKGGGLNETGSHLFEDLMCHPVHR
jgi:hypothetical protein